MTKTLPDPVAPLSAEEARTAFAAILDGKVDASNIKSFLIALADRGETPTEIAAAAKEMRARMVPVEAPAGAIDVCGTGGDGSNSLNISTATSLIIAACDIPMAKHGNRAASSKSGAADTLEALGLDLAKASEGGEQSLREIGIAFFFAPHHHPALGPIAAIRKDIGRRTIFNLLGPLCNPARVRRQLIGVSTPGLVETFAEAAAQLDYEKIMIVSGEEGLDELSISGPSKVAVVEGQTITYSRITPEDIGLPIHNAGAVEGGDAEFNAAALRRLLQGEKSAYRDAVLLNSAAALMVAGAAESWEEGVEEAAEALDKGLANAILDCWIANQQEMAE
ncbi:anthranilate phosphoribosyltransferase [Parasphingorhabdus sp.]|uniref:anthranilate phosphoribosyltransferase n=1 Tax=Parasphingorhabdus sp. TaxID=2709688 RepID=UPI002F93CF28